jgi:hypothetical protein
MEYHTMPQLSAAVPSLALARVTWALSLTLANFPLQSSHSVTWGVKIPCE